MDKHRLFSTHVVLRIISFIAATQWFCLDIASAALPFTINADRPRIYVNQARIDQITNAATAPYILNNTAFPQTSGTLIFDIYPTEKGTNSATHAPLFDQYSSKRNPHIFIRYVDSTSTATHAGFQLAFQIPNENYYLASKGFTLELNGWHTIRVSWDTDNHAVNFQIDDQPAEDRPWKTDGNGDPLAWVPDGQAFTFSGRDGNLLDNIRLYDVFDPSGAVPLLNLSMSEGSGRIVTDATDPSIRAVLNSSFGWVAPGFDGTGHALRMDGTTGKLRMVAENILTEAWLDISGQADSWTATLNDGGSPVDVANELSGSISRVARVIGLAYLATGDTDYQDALLKYADLMIAVPRVASDTNDSAQSGRVEAMALIYDWMYTVTGLNISPETGTTYRDALADAMMETIPLLLKFICGEGNEPGPSAEGACDTWPPVPNYISGHSRSTNSRVSAGLLALFGDRTDVEDLLLVEHENFINGYSESLEWISVDGGHHMGWDYGSGYTYLDYALLWNTATDVSMTMPWQGELIYRYIYGLRGDMTYPASGDAYSGGFGLRDELVTAFALWGSQHYTNTAGQWFYNRWILPHKNWERLSELMYWQPGLTESPIAALDTSRYFSNAGQVLMRDSWDYPNATLLEFKSTSFWSVNHHHLDQNAFTIFYKAPLLVDSGFYDSYGTNHWHNYFTRSIAHNTITVLDPQEVFIRNWQGGACCSNDGGQRFMEIPYPTLADIKPGGDNHLHGVTNYQYTPDFTYTVGNASKAYSSAKLDQNSGFLRHIVFLKNPSFWSHPVTVVFDKVTTQPDDPTKADLEKRFLLHTVNEPEPLNTDTMTVVNGDGMLFSQTLLPKNPVITKVGGSAGSRYLVNDKFGVLTNYPPDPAALDPGDIPGATARMEADADRGNWRIEVQAPTHTQREYFLHVISVADYEIGLSPPPAENWSSDTAAVALLNGNQVIAFNKQDDPSALVGWDAPASDLDTVVTGLAPNTQYIMTVVDRGQPTPTYTVTLCTDPAGVLQSSNAGVLEVSGSQPLAADLDGDGIGDACDADTIDLTASIIATPDPVAVEGILTYTITVTNTSVFGATGVRITDTLPADIDVIEAIPSQGGCTVTPRTESGKGKNKVVTPASVACDLATLTAGATATVAITGTVLGGTTLSNTANVTGNETDPDTSNNSATAQTTVTGGGGGKPPCKKNCL